MDHGKHRVRLSAVSTLHYVRLVYRSLLMVGFLALYLSCRFRGGEDISSALELRPLLLFLISSVFTTVMILRFFPSRLVSPGSQ